VVLADLLAFTLDLVGATIAAPHAAMLFLTTLFLTPLFFVMAAPTPTATLFIVRLRRGSGRWRSGL
jgi:hypothetical protein